MIRTAATRIRNRGGSTKGGDVLVLTEQATTVIRDILEDADAGPESGLRISGTNVGNGDASLEFSVSERPFEGDEVVQDGGATVFLDEIAALVLADKTLDVEAHDDHFHFSLDERAEAS